MINVRAKAVKRTYIDNVSQHVTALLQSDSGHAGYSKILLHESNPKIIRMVGKTLAIPPEKIPILSDRVGSLSCVSIFTLLDEILNPKPDDNFDQGGPIAVAVIGEAGDHVRAGRFSLNRQFVGTH